ncbi:NfeD family protein [Sphingomonas solaris]|uniref:NfeD family protein n=1 Tax=Alterirhizorhabdus solaris TaxID=2529389 RepID=A0A558R6Z4_9SPHN|nr:NfeD family protein [Sphingomonas solaris]TVV75155.1 NfeD family protein [Sphingomonas solaris]
MDGFAGLAPYWWWLIAALALATAEIVAPGVFLIWLGAAAAVAGILTALLGLPLLGQVIVFAVASVAGVYAARRWFQRNPGISPDPLLNDRAGQLIGMLVTVVEPIAADRGRVRVGDGVWNAAGIDAVPGETVRVIGAHGTTLLVERI